MEEIACRLWERHIKRVNEGANILNVDTPLNEHIDIDITLQHEDAEELQIPIRFRVNIENGTLNPNAKTFHAKSITIPGRWKVVRIQNVTE